MGNAGLPNLQSLYSYDQSTMVRVINNGEEEAVVNARPQRQHKLASRFADPDNAERPELSFQKRAVDEFRQSTNVHTSVPSRAPNNVFSPSTHGLDGEPAISHRSVTVEDLYFSDTEGPSKFFLSIFLPTFNSLSVNTQQLTNGWGSVISLQLHRKVA